MQNANQLLILTTVKTCKGGQKGEAKAF